MVSSERLNPHESFVPHSIGKRSEISSALKNQNIPKHFFGIKIDLFRLKNEEFDFVNMDNFKHKEPSIKKMQPQKSFMMPSSTLSNHYEKYLPSLSTPGTIPNGPRAKSLAEKLNLNEPILATKGLKGREDSKTKNITPIYDLRAQNARNFFFKQSLMEQDRELAMSFKDFRGINRVRPELKEKVRNDEFLKVTKSLLIANNNQAHELKPTNRKLLGIETNDLLHLSKYIDPQLVKSSIRTDHTTTYPDLQRHFGLRNSSDIMVSKDLGLKCLDSVDTFIAESNVFDTKKSQSLSTIGSRDDGFTLEGKRMKTKKGEEKAARGKKKINEEKSLVLAVKKFNFKKSQMVGTPIAEELKKMRTSEN